MKDLKKETIKKLETIKNNLNSQSDEENYCDMINTMIDYDNEAHDDLYLYDNCQEVVGWCDSEMLQYFIENQLKEYGVERIICALEDVHDAEIYKIDVYQNVYNVNDDDFVMCIDEAIDRLKDSSESETL